MAAFVHAVCKRLFFVVVVCSGATHSDIVILDDQGKCVGKAAGGGTNPWVSDTNLALVFVIVLLHFSK